MCHLAEIRRLEEALLRLRRTWAAALLLQRGLLRRPAVRS